MSDEFAIGKTRTLAELEYMALQRGVRVLSGRWTEVHGACSAGCSFDGVVSVFMSMGASAPEILGSKGSTEDATESTGAEIENE